MNKIIQDINGAFHLVEKAQPMTKDIAEKILEEAKRVETVIKSDIHMAEEFLAAEAAKLAGEATPAAPVTPAVTDQVQAAATPDAGTQAAPADTTVTPAAPADSNIATPTADQNSAVDNTVVPPAAPVDQTVSQPTVADTTVTATVADPNQVQPTVDPTTIAPLQ